MIVCPVWPKQAWYPHLVQLLTSNPVLLPIHNDLLLDPLGNRHPLIVNNKLLGSSRMGSLRDHLSSEGIPKEATDILLSAQCRSTNGQYKSCWAKWCCWCHQQQADNFRPALSNLVYFLTELFDQGKQCSTINTYRSAISSTVPPLDGTPLGQHKVVCSFMKGYSIRDHRNPVILALGKFLWLLACSRSGVLTVTSVKLKRLSRKCAMLLALTSAKRQSDLRALDLASVQFLPEDVEFRIPGLTKTRAPGKDVVFFFPAKAPQP